MTNCTTGFANQAIRVGTHADLGISFSAILVFARYVAVVTAAELHVSHKYPANSGQQSSEAAPHSAKHLPVGECPQHCLPDFPGPGARIAAEKVYGGREKGRWRYLHASRSQFGDVQVSYLVAGLPRCGAEGGIERLPPSFGPLPRLGLVCFPEFFKSRQRLAWVPLRCACMLGAWAGTAPPNRGRNGPLPAAQGAGLVAGALAEDDGGLWAMPWHPGTRETYVAARSVRVVSACARPARRRDAWSSARHREVPARPIACLASLRGACAGHGFR